MKLANEKGDSDRGSELSNNSGLPVELFDGEEVESTYQIGSTVFHITNRRLIRTNTWGNKRTEFSATSLFYDKIERVRLYGLEDEPISSTDFFLSLATMVTGFFGAIFLSGALQAGSGIVAILGLIMVIYVSQTEDGHSKLTLYFDSDNSWEYKFSENPARAEDVYNEIVQKIDSTE